MIKRRCNKTPKRTHSSLLNNGHLAQFLYVLLRREVVPKKKLALRHKREKYPFEIRSNKQNCWPQKQAFLQECAA